MPDELDAMLRNAAGQDRAAIIAALRRHGYRVVRQGKHEIWSNGSGSIIPVPRRLATTGTKRSIIRAMIDAETEADDD